PCNLRPFVLWGFPRLRPLLLPDGVENLRRALGAPRHMAWRRLRFRTSETSLTVPTGFIGALDADTRRRPSGLARTPRGTRCAARPGPLPGLPVHMDLTDGVGLRVLCLPGTSGADWTKERHVEVPWTLDEQGRVPIAHIDDRRLRGKRCGSE